MLNQSLPHRVVGAILLICFLYCTCLMTIYYGIGVVLVQGTSMENTIHDGDKFITNQFAYSLRDPNYNDIVILDAANVPGHELYIKRVVGLPGDELEVRDNELYRNGKKINEPYIKEKMYEEDFKTVIPEGHVYVMGDNCNHSSDSRVFDAIDYTEDVKATVLFRIQPFDQHY